MGLAEAPTPGSNALSVYYPFCLVDLLAYRESEDVEDTGEVVLSFLDDDGCQVTLRLSPHAIEALRKRVANPPDPASK